MTWQAHELSQVIEQMPVGVAVTTPQGSIEYANRQLCSVLGLGRERLERANLADLRASGSDLQNDHMRLRVLAGGSWQEEERFRTGSGDTLRVLESAHPLRDAQGRVTHFMHFLQDLSLLVVSQRVDGAAFHDKLTGLPNRNLFHNRLALAMAAARRARHGLALLSADIDGFGLVNESLGRDVGDELLRQVAARMRACLRDTDTVARLGGDDFAVILDRILEPGLAMKIAGRLLASCCADYELPRTRQALTLSIGLSLFPRDGEEADALLKRADLAMYRAKAAGRNRSELRDPGCGTRYGLDRRAGLTHDDAIRVAETQPRFQLGGDVHDAFLVDQHRLRDTHARGCVSPSGQALYENQL